MVPLLVLLFLDMDVVCVDVAVKWCGVNGGDGFNQYMPTMMEHESEIFE